MAWPHHPGAMAAVLGSCFSCRPRANPDSHRLRADGLRISRVSRCKGSKVLERGGYEHAHNLNVIGSELDLESKLNDASSRRAGNHTKSRSTHDQARKPELALIKC